ncbi:MAG: PH domain-containing protein, partial [Actinomycetota bacterium]|nr:PH domain-containing protein [Actinomycetota bacterium]
MTHTDPGRHDPGRDVPRVVRARGAGQSRSRAPRGWRPATIASAYLMPGEHVVRQETRSVRGFLAAQVLWLGLAVLVPVVGAMFDPALLALGVVVALGIIGLLVVRGVQAAFTRYLVTDMRVLRVSGVLNRSAEFIPWGKVTDITRTESLVQWLAHTATIRIESANERSSFRAIDDIDDPDAFYRVIVQL